MFERAMEIGADDTRRAPSIVAAIFESSERAQPRAGVSRRHADMNLIRAETRAAFVGMSHLTARERRHSPGCALQALAFWRALVT